MRTSDPGDMHTREDVAGEDRHAQRQHEHAGDQCRGRAVQDEQQDADPEQADRRHERGQHQHELSASQL